MTWIDEWEGSEDELIEISENCVLNFSLDSNVSESDELLSKLYLEALSRTDVQAVIRSKMEEIYDEYSRHMFSRLTRRENGHAYFSKCFDGAPCFGECAADHCDMINQVCEKLAAYEDAEEEKRYGSC